MDHCRGLSRSVLSAAATVAILWTFADVSASPLSSGAADLQRGSVEDACWGQATKVFAQMGEMGAHSRDQPTPRLGLRNLARLLYEQGVLPDDTMEALGAFVAGVLGLSIEACM